MLSRGRRASRRRPFPAPLPLHSSHRALRSVLCILTAEHAQEDHRCSTFPFPAYRIFLKEVSQSCKPEQPVTYLATDGAQESHYLPPDKELCKSTAGPFQYPFTDARFCFVSAGSSHFSHTLPIKWKQQECVTRRRLHVLRLQALGDRDFFTWQCYLHLSPVH